MKTPLHKDLLSYACSTQTLENEYQASLETLLPLKMQLMRCDRLIDAIVYRLYGLSEEERAIVEGRGK